MDSLLSASFLSSAGQFLIDFPLISSLLLGAIFVIRGEVSTLLTIYLISQGYLGWVRFIVIALVSIILGDILLYYIGKFSRGTRFSSYFEKKFETTKKLESYLHDNTAKALILTKYTMGLGSVAALLSGWSKIDFKRFLWLNSLSIALWLGVMTSLSSIFLEAWDLVGARQAYDKAGLFLGVMVVLIFVFEYLMEEYFTKSSGISEE